MRTDGAKGQGEAAPARPEGEMDALLLGRTRDLKVGVGNLASVFLYFPLFLPAVAVCLCVAVSLPQHNHHRHHHRHHYHRGVPPPQSPPQHHRNLASSRTIQSTNPP
ncbi:hypothetical protein E2C01_043271 [Portunus trituberculatus]|uniref:Uncharacterized protein n=1 Tax=Portunus trituberculatus TaxID=210409 RepID=A0A5B7FVV7_PORTR|nr:hypothetical protein [Portunus trituberculatus]